MEQQVSPAPTAVPAADDVTARVRAIRARLPGQVLCERQELAAAAYGPLLTLPEIRQKIGETLPRRVGYVRGAVIEPIEQYQRRIPDEALLKFDDAARSGLFSTFWVASPTYYQERQVDPWILGEVAGTSLYAVIAQWDV